MFDDLATRLANTKLVKETQDYAYLDEGTHRLLLIEMVPYESKKLGPAARATFEVIESTVHPVGSRVSNVWGLTRSAAYVGGDTDLDKVAHFVRRIAGMSDTDNPSQAAIAVIRDRVNEQLLRGMMVDCKLTIRTTKNAKTWKDVKWSSIKQTQEEIAAKRAELDQRHPYKADFVAPAPAAAPASAPVNLLSQIPGFGK